MEERHKHDLVSAARGGCRSAATTKDIHTQRNTYSQLFLDFYTHLRGYAQNALDRVLSTLPSYMVISSSENRSGRRKSTLSRHPSSSSPPVSPSALALASTHAPSLSLSTSSYASFNGTPLETIPEAADSDSDGTYVSDNNTKDVSSPSPPPHSPPSSFASSPRLLQQSRSKKSDGADAALRSSSSRGGSSLYGVTAVDFVAAVAAWPYSVAVTVLAVVVPQPVQKLFT